MPVLRPILIRAAATDAVCALGTWKARIVVTAAATSLSSSLPRSWIRPVHQAPGVSFRLAWAMARKTTSRACSGASSLLSCSTSKS